MSLLANLTEFAWKKTGRKPALMSVSVCLAIAFASTCLSQDSVTERRFKHEKHGAIVFATGNDYEIKCDLYVPKSDQPRPVMLAIHGGAWTTGTKFAMYRHARMLANRGYVVMAINYRLAPDHKWPAQIHDCKHAVRWIKEHAAEYNADPSRVYAYGYSAGGHLAALLATTNEGDGLEGDAKDSNTKFSSRIQGAIIGGSPLEFGWIGEESTALKYWLGESKGSNPAKYKEASPTTYVSNGDPAIVVYHGNSDTLVPTSSPKRFIQKCQQTKVPSELILTNSGHIGAFSNTTLFLECLHKFESLLKTKQRIKLDQN